MRRGGEAAGASAGLRIAAARSSGHAVPRPLSLGVVLCPDVAEPELSLPRGAWLCAEAIPLETSNAVAANMAEYFLISYFFSLRRYSPLPTPGDASVPAFCRRRYPFGHALDGSAGLIIPTTELCGLMALPTQLARSGNQKIRDSLVG